MVKILSQAGRSLADVYDVQGSIAGIDQLETRELPIVHEMGATVFSERFSGAIRRSSTGAIAQSTTWDLVLTNLPATPARVFGVVVFSGGVTRLSNAMVAIRDAVDGREIPIFAWDANEASLDIRLVDDGNPVNTVSFLQNALSIGTLPSMIVGAGQPQEVNDIAFRGVTTAFGAGTVTTTMLLYIGFSEIAFVPSSFGLPIPGW